MTNISKDTFECRDDGLYYGEEKLLDFVPVIDKVIEELSANKCQLTYATKILRGNIVVDIVILQELFVKSWFSLSSFCPDAALTEKNRRLLQYFLEQQVSDAPIIRRIKIEQMGWHKFDSGQLYYGNQVFVAGIAEELQIINENKDIIHCEEYETDLSSSANICMELMQLHKGVSWILFLVSFMDILKELFRKAGYPMEFIFNIYGKSGIGKTALTKLECNPAQVFSFRSSKRRDILLKELQSFKGRTVLVDDYHPAENLSDRNRQSGLKDALVRYVEEISDSPNLIITSEYLEGHLSLQDREIQIFLDKETDWKLLDSLEKKKVDMEKIRTAFYVQIVAHMEEVIKDIKRFCQCVDANYDSNQKVGYRISRYSQYICCVHYLFQKYFAEYYGIMICDYNIEQAVRMQLERQIQHVDRVCYMEQHHTYLIAVRNMLMESDVLKQVNDMREFVPNADTKHVDSRGRVALAPKALLRGMMIYLQTQDIPIKKIVNEMKTAEVLITYTNSRDLTRIHKEKRYYLIDTEALNEYCSFFE